MAFEKRDMSGGLFPNRDRKSDNHPTLNGYLIIEGVEYWLSGWTKENSNGKWISLSAKPKEERAQEIRNSYDEPSRAPAGFEDDTEIPF